MVEVAKCTIVMYSEVAWKWKAFANFCENFFQVCLLRNPGNVRRVDLVPTIAVLRTSIVTSAIASAQFPQIPHTSALFAAIPAESVQQITAVPVWFLDNLLGPACYGKLRTMMALHLGDHHAARNCRYPYKRVPGSLLINSAPVLRFVDLSRAPCICVKFW